jgi:hypothetical protein
MLLLSQFITTFWKAGREFATLHREAPDLQDRTYRGPVQSDNFPRVTKPNHHPAKALSGGKTVRLESYESLAELGRQLKATECHPEIPLPTVVLVLSSNFAGDIPSLIQRSAWGPRLVIVAESGCIPMPRGMLPGDLIAAESALGWGQIVFERDLEAAVRGSLESLEAGESLVVLWPARQGRSFPMELLRGHTSRSNGNDDQS